MLIYLSSSRPSADISGSDDLRSLAVEIADRMSPAEAADRLGALGHIDGDHAWLHISLLRVAAHPCGARDRSTEFDSMINYAASNGWVDAAGLNVQAHIHRPDQ